jgi:hypothetical protein
MIKNKIIILNHWCLVKYLRFFASLKMTGLFIFLDGEGVGWRQSRQPTPSPRLKQLNVISNEVRT